MEVKQENILKIEVKDKEVDTLKSVLKKISKESSKSGFNNMFTVEEKSFIKNINEKL